MKLPILFCGIVGIVCCVMSSGCSTLRKEAVEAPMDIPLVMELDHHPCGSLNEDFKSECLEYEKAKKL